MLEGNTALVLAPHPDDEALGCSGTLVLINRRGTASTIVYLTDGEKLHGESAVSVAKERRGEGSRSAAMLGCKEGLFLGIPDGEVSTHNREIFHQLSAMVEEKKPDIILSPSPIDYHADHIATARIALKLRDAFPTVTVAFYEVYSTIRFNCLVDIGDTVAQKREAILNYRTSLYGKPEIYVHAATGLNAHRSLFRQNKSYYEAFYLVEKGESLDSILRHFCYSDR